VDDTLILAISVGLLFLLLISGAHIFVVLGICGLLALALLGGLQAISGSLVWGRANSWVFAAIPLFIFMGEILLRSRIANDLYTGVTTWLGPLPGGLIHTNIAACAIFGALSGSSTATTVTIGSVAIPEQMKRGYDRKLILGSIVGAGTLGMLIPPSINMILYGIWVEVSIGRLFMAGVIPGILVAILFMAYVAYAASRNPQIAPRTRRPTLKGMLSSVKLMAPIFSIAIVMLGGLYLGWITPTETAAVGVFLALLLAAAKRSINWRIIRDSAQQAIITTAFVMAILFTATIFAHVLLRLGIANSIQTFMGSGDYPKWLVLMMVYIVYLILGCFLDGISIMLITLPVMVPILTGLGVDFIWFGVMVILLTEVGLLTPPVGFNLFVMLGMVKGSTIREVAVAALPFVLILLLGITILTLFPQVALWLPGTMVQ